MGWLKAWPRIRWVRERGRDSMGWSKELLRDVARSRANTFLGVPANKSDVSWGDSKNRRWVREGGSEFTDWLKDLPSRRMVREEGSKSMGWLKEEPSDKVKRDDGRLVSG